MIVAIRQVKLREIDYEDLTQTDHLVRHVLNDDLTLTEARRWLARIVSSGHHTPRWAITAGLGRDVRRRRRPARRQRDRHGDRLAGGDEHRPAAAAAGQAPAAVLLPAGGRRAAGDAAHRRRSKATGIPMDTSLVVTANIVMLLAGIGFMGALQDALTGLLHHRQRPAARSRPRHRRHHRRRQRGPERGQPPRRRRRRAGARPHERDRRAAGRGRRRGRRPARSRSRRTHPPFLLPIAVIAGRGDTSSTWRS